MFGLISIVFCSVEYSRQADKKHQGKIEENEPDSQVSVISFLIHTIVHYFRILCIYLVFFPSLDIFPIVHVVLFAPIVLNFLIVSIVQVVPIVPIILDCL